MVQRARLIPYFCITIITFLLLPFHTAPVHAEEILSPQFVNYYWQHKGERVLGRVESPLIEIDGYPMQYFEKGRLEDRRGETDNPDWAVAYSRLTIDLMELRLDLPIAGSPVTYGELQQYGTQLQEPPAGFAGGTIEVEGGTFVPFNGSLSSTPGYVVPSYFWRYINRPYLFPGGWMHDIGLPLTPAFDVMMEKDGKSRIVVMQAFERAVLTYDALNPFDWRVERANIGTDAVWVAGMTPLYQQPSSPMPPPPGPKRIEVSLEQQWLYAYDGDQLVYDMPVSTGKDGFNTPPGRFAVYDKVPMQTLRGSAGDETWEVPDVPYVMYYYGDVAIHTAYWHGLLGTGVRLSHGCVHLSPGDAETLYNWTPIGTPVIVY